MAETVPNSRTREIGKIVPQDRADRDTCRAVVREYAGKCDLVPPLSFDELEEHALGIAQAQRLPTAWCGFLMVLLNNEIWRDIFAATPYERRLLLLPQCLRSGSECSAQTDEMGLLCAECGNCPIGAIQALAERLGYLVLVAEGATLVLRLLESGTVDAVAGVSCLSALERSFPQAVANAIPSLAVPLHADGCVDTEVDLDWVHEMVTLASDSGKPRRIEMEALRRRVADWFEPDALREVLGEPQTQTERTALSWLAKTGKRWRPLLVAVAFDALAEECGGGLDRIRPLAVAVECFHKASLIHDDIEDNDQRRYGGPALHSEYGVPIAVNVGDLLIGEGYRLLVQCDFLPETRARLAMLAAEAHRTLCTGQGEELEAARWDFPVSLAQMLSIFRMKTSPAFGVALKFGAVAAGADDALCESLDVFSNALGIAYQIRDDISDISEGVDCAGSAAKPSIFSALAWEAGHREACDVSCAPAPQLVEKAEMLFEHYRNEAIRSLSAFRNAELKTQLRRLLERLLEM